MALLHYGTLVPNGDSGIAVLRFSSSVRLSCIRVFPTGPTPISELVACTEPSAFLLDIFFNATPITPETKARQRPINELVPTSIAYPGGMVDFEAEMEAGFATRLMIVKGEFSSVSFALYGEIVGEAPASPVAYEPQPWPNPTPIPPSDELDPASMPDPTALAQELVASITKPPPSLAALIRLTCCQKPVDDDDWDLPDFPHIFANLEAEYDGVFTLSAALEILDWPIRDETPVEVLNAFAARVAETIGPSDENQSYQLAHLLCIAASQQPEFVHALLEQVNPRSVLDAQSIKDTDTLLYLFEATANPDIARHFRCPEFLDVLDKLQANLTIEKRMKDIADQIARRVEGWRVFEDALGNPAGDVDAAAKFVADIGLDEQSMGIWLLTMVERLSDIPAESQPLPGNFLRRRGPRTHAELVVFTRAYIGVGYILAVLSWMDSIGDEPALSTALTLVRLWQTIHGYREIVNHLLLIRQFTKRLQWTIADNHPPSLAGITCERIAEDVAQDPHALLSVWFLDLIDKLEPPLSSIPKSETLILRKLATIANDKLHGAVDELKFATEHPFSLRRLRNIRVSLAVIEKELDSEGDAGEWNVLEALWTENAHGLADRLVQLFVDVSDDLAGHFGVSLPPEITNNAFLVQLLRTADDLLRLIVRLTTRNIKDAQMLTIRALRALASGITDAFAATNSALLPKAVPIIAAATDLRDACLEVVSKFVGPEVYVEPRKPAAEVLVRALLEQAQVTRVGRDPVEMISQTLTLFDHILPQPGTEDDRWVSTIIPLNLFELTAFVRLLDPERKVSFVVRLIKLDNGQICVGEWLLTGELKQLSRMLEETSHLETSSELRLAEHHQLFLSLSFLSKLINSSTDISQWLTNAITNVPEVASLFANCFTAVLEQYLVSPVLDDITRVLAMRAEAFSADLKSALILTTFRAFRHEPRVLLDVLRQTLPWEPTHPRYPALLRTEIGLTLAGIANGKVSAKLAITVLGILTWLAQRERAGDPSMTALYTRAISAETLQELYTKLGEALPPASLPALKAASAAIRADEDDSMDAAHPCTPTILPTTLSLPLPSLLALLDSPAQAHHLSPPSTPKTSHTPGGDIFGVLTSPSGLLRSPAATGLTKTYQKNDFRLLRQAPAARLNTSRLPSMHVDVGIPGHPA
ncbi:hypothetical protein MKEN_00128100 [Mycena kentingensis (nom. inval.)]|nr:hypothetical protein MKEN_00128100 [Mycena kentingensis (nom. inval.)]